MTNEPRGSSIVEIGAINTPAERYDVAILGGGLAGLTLAIQLKNERSATSVVVLEKREGPAPLAAFKVGESTVAAGAHYFSEVVGMREHLEKEQLVKCGLRYFQTDGDNSDITTRAEKGPFAFPAHDNYQLDRGLFENTLAARARSLGVDVAQGARIREVTLGDPHRVAFEQFDRPASTEARWVVDASGRASLLKRQLGLQADSGHHVNSSWIRLAGGFDIEDWGRDNEAWMGRMTEPGLRKFSTNHLLGEGYWVWLIPLSSGPISIGICADPRLHPFEEMNELDGFLDWLRRHEPQLAATIESRTDDIEDFLRVEDFSYGVKQTYSTDRWSLVGEAGAFADPFFSPGSDFIGYGNTLTADLIVRDLDGEDITERVGYYDRLYQRVFAHIISRYQDTYPIYGNPGIVSVLLNWDFYSTHTGIVFLFVKNKLTDLEFMKSVEDDLDRLFQLNINIHTLFLKWNELQPPEALLAAAGAGAEVPAGPPPGFAPPGMVPGAPPPGFGMPGGPMPGAMGGPPPGFGPGGPGGPPPGLGPPGVPPGGPPGGPPPGVGPGGPPPGFGPGGPGGPPGDFKIEDFLKAQGINVVDQVLQSLINDFPDDDALRAELHEHLTKTEATAVDIFRYAARFLPDDAQPDDRPVNPYAVSLEPDKWESDGLYESG
jgi:flavin-dependent dehydrogenase